MVMSRPWDASGGAKLFALETLNKIRSYRRERHWASQINSTHRTMILGPVQDPDDPHPDVFPVRYPVRIFSNGTMQNGKIVEVHRDDPQGPYYTVERADGSFFQTTHSRLEMLKLVEEEDGGLAPDTRFQRQSMIDIDRILNARFPQGSVSFPDGGPRW